MSFDKDNVNKLFAQFKNKYVSVDLRDNNQAEGKIIAIDNYLNLVLENENGIQTIKGGNVVFVSLKEDKK
ncbi:LSM domain-containing protein [Methanobrevibacter sp.]